MNPQSTATTAEQQCLPQNGMYYLRMTKGEWGKLEQVAQSQGMKDARRWLRSQVFKFAAANSDLPRYNKKQKKLKNNFELPAELIPFYVSMANMHGVTVNQIIFRYIIQPHLIFFDNPTTTIAAASSFQKATQTAPPNFSTTIALYSILKK
jgi:hypothetical protein